jgi:flavin reductase (DIM6/NTAB) family NADH-FMN oxidoreductase RutF
MKKTLSNTKLFQAGPLSVVVMATAINAEGQANIITLGMYMPISFSPPLVCIGIAPQRYSHDLISRSGELELNPGVTLINSLQPLSPPFLPKL